MERQGTNVARLGAIVVATLLVALPTAAQLAPSRRPAAETTPKGTEPVTRLEVAVRDDKGEPIEGALVFARPSSGGYLPFGGLDPEKTRATVADSEGRATLESLPPGPWTVTVQARGFAPKTARRVEAGPLEVRLDRGGVITGVVADAGGVPLFGARVSLGRGLTLPSAWATEASRVERTADAEGRFRLEGIGVGPVNVAARAPGYGRATRDGVEAGAHVELFLFPGATLSGAVVDGEGRPIEDALVQAVGSGLWPTLLPSERTDPEGRFVMAGAEEGEYVVMAREGGWAPGLGRALVKDEAEASVEIVLTDGGYVTGRLIDVDGQPLEGHAEALVFEGLGLPDLFRDRFSTDARSGGTFVLSPLPTGDFEIAVSAPGHAPGRREAWVADDGATVDLGDVVLNRGLTIRGRVVDEEGLAVEGARVRARPQSPSGARVPETQSDAEGRFEVSGLEEGPWEVAASAPGFAHGSVSARAGDEGLELTLKGGGEITGRVVDAEGQPVPEARIHAQPAEGSPQRRPAHGVYVGAEDEDGRFVLRDVATGTWVLEASATGKGEASVSGLRVAGGRTTDVGTVRLARGGVIRGTVVDGDGRGLPGATVQAERDIHSRSGRHQTQSGSGGAFELRGVPAGRLAVFAHHPSFAPSPAEIVEVDPPGRARTDAPRPLPWRTDRGVCPPPRRPALRRRTDHGLGPRCRQRSERHRHDTRRARRVVLRRPRPSGTDTSPPHGLHAVEPHGIGTGPQRPDQRGDERGGGEGRRDCQPGLPAPRRHRRWSGDTGPSADTRDPRRPHGSGQLAVDLHGADGAPGRRWRGSATPECDHVGGRPL